MDLAVRGIGFGAVGTAGKRCTSTRRVFAHESILPELSQRLIAAYKQVRIGNPLVDGTLMGPLISTKAVKAMQAALKGLRREGGQVLYGGETRRGWALSWRRAVEARQRHTSAREQKTPRRRCFTAIA